MSDVFGTYLQLLCSDQVVFTEDGKDLDHVTIWEVTIKLYLLAHQLEDCISANLIIDELAKMVHDGALTPNQIGYVYSHEEDLWPLRRLLVDFAVEEIPADYFTPRMMKKWSQEFVCDVAMAFARRRDAEGQQDDETSARDSSRYHLDC